MTEDDYIGYLARDRVVSAVPVGSPRGCAAATSSSSATPRDWSSRVLLDRLWGTSRSPIAPGRCSRGSTRSRRSSGRYRDVEVIRVPLADYVGALEEHARSSGNGRMTDRRSPASPYKGLAPFEDSELDALLFFGRDGERRSSPRTCRRRDSRCSTGRAVSARARCFVGRRTAACDRCRTREVAVFSSWAEDPTEAIDAVFIATAGRRRPVPDHRSARGALPLPAGPTLRLRGGSRSSSPAAPRQRLVGMREDALAKLDFFKGRIPDLFSNYLRLDHLDRAAAQLRRSRPARAVKRAVAC